jgi:hypothetical protein
VKRLLAIALAAALAAPVAVPSASAAPSPAQLQREVNALKSQVSQLRSRLSKLESDLADTQEAVTETFAVSVCGQAMLWDAFSALVFALGGTLLPRFDDGGTCAALGVTRRSVGTGPSARDGPGNLRLPARPPAALFSAAPHALR